MVGQFIILESSWAPATFRGSRMTSPSDWSPHNIKPSYSVASLLLFRRDGPTDTASLRFSLVALDGSDSGI